MNMQRALDHLRSTGQPVLAADVARLAPLGYAHLNLLGRCTFALPEPISQGEWHPRNTTSHSYFPFRFYREPIHQVTEAEEQGEAVALELDRLRWELRKAAPVVPPSGEDMREVS